jgi:hypothetical protein
MTLRSTHVQPATVISGIDQTVIHVPRLTVKMLADKLCEIEKSNGYEIAMLGVESLDYLGICHLCLENHPDNDPHLMPSRFMMLWGAADEDLKKTGNLDTYPYEHDGDEHLLSVQNLSELLAYVGWNPYRDDGIHEAAEETDEEADSSDAPDPSRLTGHLFGALCAYLEDAPPALGKELPGPTLLTVQAERLEGIAAELGIREWRLLWALNKDALGGDSTDVPAGTSLQLPDEDHNPLVLWFQDNGWDGYLNSGKGYQYPGKYLRLSVSDQDRAAIDKPDRTCEVYLSSGTPSLLYRLDLQGSKDLKLVVPDTPDIAVALQGEDLVYRGRTWPHWDDFLARGGELPDTATA